ncbi:MAG: YggS family pyridoxal phosphate-dependent enzyme [Kineosporiaceae bacterium]|nr:YggS family pyridoxal phosphate-dependent enzyme [Kineosporiaceae bacterium]
MTAHPGGQDPRTRELAQALAVVNGRIEAACAATGRSPGELTLVVVTKTHPVDDVIRLAGLGVRHVGESRDQEAGPKAAQVRAAVGDIGLHWHFVGRLQSNKARHVARYADLVHSVDRASLVEALDRGAQAAGRRLDCLVQVSLDVDPSRGGAPPRDVPGLADRIAACAGLRLAGVMAVAPLDADPLVAFGTLVGVSTRLCRDHPDATVISAGMSGDLEAAVTVGATHLRVGSAVLGHRAPLG